MPDPLIAKEHSMKTSHRLSLAAAVLAAIHGVPALALTPGQIAADPNILRLHFSGASAQQLVVGAEFASLCAAGTLDTYFQSDVANSPDWRNYACRFAAIPAVPAALQNRNAILHTRSRGGSVWGVVPVGNSWFVEFLSSENGTCNPTGNPATATVASFTCPSVVNRSTAVVDISTPADGTLDECAASAPTAPGVDRNTKCRIPDLGFSDVEAAMFTQVNLPPGNAPLQFPVAPIFRPWSPLAATAIAGMTTSSNFGVIFGVIVTHDVYTDLQIQDGLIPTGSLFPDGAAAQPPGNTLNATLRPSLSRAEVRSVLNGQVQNWAAILGASLTNASGGFGEAAVCRRVAGSGTQAGANAYFLNNPCMAGGQVPTVQSMVTAANTAPPNYIVQENSSTGTLLTCMNGSFAGTLTGQQFPMGALGFTSLERVPGAADRWAFVEIDGVSPDRGNAVWGEYDYEYEATAQFVTGLPHRLAGVDRTDTQTAINAFLNSFRPPFAIGTVGLESSGFQWDAAASLNTVTRMNRGGNSCNSPILAPDRPAPNEPNPVNPPL
jgi:hypothetical protein